MIQEGTGSRMKYAVICFTERGAWVCRRLFHKLKETGEECEAIIPKRFLREEWKKEGLKEREEESLSQWTGKMFAQDRVYFFPLQQPGRVQQGLCIGRFGPKSQRITA